MKHDGLELTDLKEESTALTRAFLISGVSNIQAKLDVICLTAKL